MTTQHITERAMLLKVTIHQWTARRNDKKISREVADQHGADRSMGAYHKDLVARDSLKEISELSGQIRAAVYRITLPWLDDGSRILPSAFYFSAMEQLKALIHDREAKVEAFLAKWPEVVADAKKRLNGLFDEADYPAPKRLRKLFDVDLAVLPIPSGDDFRVPLGKADEEAQIKAQVDDRVNQLLAAATRDVWQRIHALVAGMAERLRAYRVDPETSKITGIFRDSLVTNIVELIDLLPGLNINNDPELDQMTERLRDGLTVYDAQDLRDDEKARDIVAGRAEKILADIGEFLA
jgi:hypothetical protein